MIATIIILCYIPAFVLVIQALFKWALYYEGCPGREFHLENWIEDNTWLGKLADARGFYILSDPAPVVLMLLISGLVIFIGVTIPTILIGVFYVHATLLGKAVLWIMLTCIIVPFIVRYMRNKVGE